MTPRPALPRPWAPGWGISVARSPLCRCVCVSVNFKTGQHRTAVLKRARPRAIVKGTTFSTVLVPDDGDAKSAVTGGARILVTIVPWLHKPNKAIVS